MNRLDRRTFGVSGVGAVVGLLTAAPASAARAAAANAVSAPVTPTPAADVPSWLIAPLRSGSKLGSGWRIREVSGVVRGAYVLQLSHSSGNHVELHLCRLEGAARGLTSTKHLDVFVMNGGDGAVPSDEELGLVVLSLARRIRENEARQGAAAEPPAGVLSYQARIARYFSV
jgi:hypothetical protein